MTHLNEEYISMRRKWGVHSCIRSRRKSHWQHLDLEMYQFCWYVVWVTETLFTQQKLIWNLDTPVKTCLMRCLMRMGTPCENVLEILAVVVLLSPISSVRGSHWGMYEWRVTHRSRNIFGESWTSYESHTHILRYLRWVMYIMTLRWFDESWRSQFETCSKSHVRVTSHVRRCTWCHSSLIHDWYMTRGLKSQSHVRRCFKLRSTWLIESSKSHESCKSHARVTSHASRVTSHVT